MVSEITYSENRGTLIAVCTKALLDSFAMLIGAKQYESIAKETSEHERLKLKMIDLESRALGYSHPEMNIPFGNKPAHVIKQLNALERRRLNALKNFALAELHQLDFTDSENDYELESIQWQNIAVRLIYEYLLPKKTKIGAPSKGNQRPVSCAIAFDTMKSYCKLFQGLNKEPKLSPDIKFTTSLLLQIYKDIFRMDYSEETKFSLEVVEGYMKFLRAEINVASNVISKGRKILKEKERFHLVLEYDQIIRSKPYTDFTINDFIYNEKNIG